MYRIDELREVVAVGHKFSLVLSREITEEESVVLRDKGFSEAVFGTDSHPTLADTVVTRVDFDDTGTPSLAEAIDGALAAVKTLPDLGVPGLMVPAQPAPAGSAAPDGEVIAESTTV